MARLFLGLAVSLVLACSTSTRDGTQSAGGGGATASGGSTTAAGNAGTSRGGTSSGAGGATGSNGAGAGNTSGGTPNGGTTASGAAAGSGGLLGGTGGASAGTGGVAGNAAGSAGNPHAGTAGGSAGSQAGSAGAGGAAYNPCPPAGQPCKIMPFGDSITDGFNVPGGYRIELFRLAQQAGKRVTFVGAQTNGPTDVAGVPFPRAHEGHSGFTIENEPQVGRTGIAPLAGPSIATYAPHIITLMIGTNDMNLNVDVADAPARLGALMDSILAADPNLLLVVARIVPTTTDALNTRVQSYNAAIPALVASRAMAGRHVLLVDMYAAFTRDANYKTALLADDLHPNTAGYARIAEIWYAALEPFLR